MIIAGNIGVQNSREVGLYGVFPVMAGDFSITLSSSLNDPFTALNEAEASAGSTVQTAFQGVFHV